MAVWNKKLTTFREALHNKFNLTPPLQEGDIQKLRDAILLQQGPVIESQNTLLRLDQSTTLLKLGPLFKCQSTSIEVLYLIIGCSSKHFVLLVSNLASIRINWALLSLVKLKSILASRDLCVRIKARQTICDHTEANQRLLASKFCVAQHLLLIKLNVRPLRRIRP